MSAETKISERPGALNAELAEAARRAGLAPDELLARAERAAARSGTRFDRTLAELGLVPEEELSRFIAEWARLPFLERIETAALPATGTGWDPAFLRRMRILPIALDQGGLLLAMADPLDRQLADTIQFQHGLRVSRAVATPRAIDSALTRICGGRDGSESDPDTAATADVERLRGLANDGPIVRLVNAVIAAAVDASASDIHFECMETELFIRFRVDGELTRHREVSDADKAAVTSRLKVMAGLNISERRLPQDGRIRLAVRGRDIDFRVSCLPTQHGESIVLRVLDQSRLALDWAALGFDQGLVARIEHLTSRPHGLFLVTGPTGSGKTTTLYTALSRLDATSRKIVTLEDPIEYSLPGINQVQINEEVGFSFALALRAVLRQDPNVVMVGEIRDLPTAENAIRAALMGRMVLSTVHTNSAVGAIDRLVDFGVPPFLLAATLRGVLSQRLVRRLCGHCAEPCTDAGQKRAVLAGLGQHAPEVIRLRSPAGCGRCSGSGYSGRVVIAELLEIQEALRVAISDWKGSASISTAAAELGLLPLRVAALNAAANGDVALSETVQVIDLPE